MATLSVALFAYNCRPRSGSDPGLGWQWAELGGRFADVTLYTRASNRALIESAPPLDGVRPVYVDLPERSGARGIGNPWYDAQHCLRWLRAAVAEAEEAHRSRPFDLSHFATFSAYWMPAPFHRLDIPHVGGVFTGGETTDPRFDEFRTGADRARDGLRTALIAAATRHPDWTKTYRRPGTLAVVESTVLGAAMGRRGARHVEVWRPPMSMGQELRSELEAIRRSVGSTDGRPPMLVASGRHVRWKGFRWAIDALDVVSERHPDARLVLIGDGPDQGSLRQRAGESRSAGRIEFLNVFELAEERRRIAEADVFLFPSERDGGAAVLQFAMALGTPIVGFGVGAAPTVTGPGVARWVDVDTERPGHALGHAVIDLIDDPSAAAAMIDAGVARIDGDLSEDAAASALAAWYDAAVRGHEAVF